jgi:hypothetical protein
LAVRTCRSIRRYQPSDHRRALPLQIEIEPWGGVVLRWRGFTLLIDPTGAWLAHDGRILTRFPVAIA